MRSDGHAPLPAVRLVVCDMAGTTVADEGLVEHAFDAAAREAGVVPGGGEHARMRGYVRATMGASKITVFRDLFGDEERAQTANAAFERAYAEAVGQGRCAPVPGAEQALARLRSEGRAVVLTTGFAPATRDAILAALGWRDRVDGALSPADAGRGRPFPDLVLAALLHTAAADAVAEVAVVGDTRSDITAGRRAGAGLVAGVLTGAHGEEELRDAGADAVLESVADLPDLLRDRGL